MAADELVMAADEMHAAATALVEARLAYQANQNKETSVRMSSAYSRLLLATGQYRGARLAITGKTPGE